MIDRIKAHLIKKYGLVSKDFFVIEKGEDRNIIVRRAGIDKIEKKLGGIFTVSQIHTCPYGDKIAASVAGHLEVNGSQFTTTASAHPDNCKFNNYLEIAEKRCRHRLLLKAASLYEFGVYSEDESEEFSDTAKRVEKAKDIISDFEAHKKKGNRRA